MKYDSRKADEITVTLEGAEHAVVVACVQEALTYIEEWEFFTLIGASPDDVKGLFATLVAKNDSARPELASPGDGSPGSVGTIDGVSVTLSGDGLRQVTQCMNAVVNRLRSGALHLPADVSAQSAERLLDELLEAYDTLEQS